MSRLDPDIDLSGYSKFSARDIQLYNGIAFSENDSGSGLGVKGRKDRSVPLPVLTMKVGVAGTGGTADEGNRMVSIANQFHVDSKGRITFGQHQSADADTGNMFLSSTGDVADGTAQIKLDTRVDGTNIFEVFDASSSLVKITRTDFTIAKQAILKTGCDVTGSYEELTTNGKTAKWADGSTKSDNDLKSGLRVKRGAHFQDSINVGSDKYEPKFSVDSTGSLATQGLAKLRNGAEVDTFLKVGTNDGTTFTSYLTTTYKADDERIQMDVHEKRLLIAGGNETGDGQGMVLITGYYKELDGDAKWADGTTKESQRKVGLRVQHGAHFEDNINVGPDKSQPTFSVDNTGKLVTHGNIFVGSLDDNNEFEASLKIKKEGQIVCTMPSLDIGTGNELGEGHGMMHIKSYYKQLKSDSDVATWADGQEKVGGELGLGLLVDHHAHFNGSINVGSNQYRPAFSVDSTGKLTTQGLAKLRNGVEVKGSATWQHTDDTTLVTRPVAILFNDSETGTFQTPGTTANPAGTTIDKSHVSGKGHLWLHGEVHAAHSKTETTHIADTTTPSSNTPPALQVDGHGYVNHAAIGRCLIGATNSYDRISDTSTTKLHVLGAVEIAKPGQDALIVDGNVHIKDGSLRIDQGSVTNLQTTELKVKDCCIAIGAAATTQSEIYLKQKFEAGIVQYGAGGAIVPNFKAADDTEYGAGDFELLKGNSDHYDEFKREQMYPVWNDYITFTAPGDDDDGTVDPSQQFRELLTAYCSSTAQWADDGEDACGLGIDFGQFMPVEGEYDEPTDTQLDSLVMAYYEQTAKTKMTLDGQQVDVVSVGANGVATSEVGNLTLTQKTKLKEILMRMSRPLAWMRYDIKEEVFRFSHSIEMPNMVLGGRLWPAGATKPDPEYVDPDLSSRLYTDPTLDDSEGLHFVIKDTGNIKRRLTLFFERNQDGHGSSLRMAYNNGQGSVKVMTAFMFDD